MRGHVRMGGAGFSLCVSCFGRHPRPHRLKPVPPKAILASEDARQTSFAAHRRSDWRSRAVQTNSVSRAKGKTAGVAFASVDFSLRGLNSTQAKI